MIIARSFALLSNISIGNSKQAITLGYENIFEIFPKCYLFDKYWKTAINSSNLQ